MSCNKWQLAVSALRIGMGDVLTFILYVVVPWSVYPPKVSFSSFSMKAWFTWYNSFLFSLVDDDYLLG